MATPLGFRSFALCSVMSLSLTLLAACVGESNDDAGGGSASGGALSAGAGGSFGGSVPAAGGASGGAVSASGGMFPALFDGVAEQAEHAVPIAGGTLLVSRSGELAVAADADRDRVYLVDLGSRTVREVRLTRDSEPGRIAEAADGTLFVLLRRAGALVAIDPVTAEITATRAVCSAPRGLAYDERTNALHVACRSGRLVTLDATSLEVTRLLHLDPDLRDVIIRDDGLVVTRFKSAELLVLDQAGDLVIRARLIGSTCSSATVAYRAVGDGHGHVLVAHQLASDADVRVTLGSYGSSCTGPLVNSMVSLAAPEEPPPSATGTGDPLDGLRLPFPLRSALLELTSGPLDIAVDPSGTRLAVISASAFQPPAGAPPGGYQASGTLRIGSIGVDEFGTRPALSPDEGRPLGQPVAVAFDASGGTLVQSREPATLEFADGTRLTLSDEPQRDTGLRMFYANAAGLACASCHPEGEEDGHTFHFDFGLRRTQSLAGGVLSRAPFHWDGDLHDMGALVEEVMVKRMALQARPSTEQIAALGRWLDGIPQPRIDDDLEPGAVERGRELFASAAIGCATCHGGPQLTDNLAHDVGTGGEFFTPSLLGVGLRSALFHDGCAASVTARFGVCGGGDRHGTTSGLSAAEGADLVEYLRSL